MRSWAVFVLIVDAKRGRIDDGVVARCIILCLSCSNGRFRFQKSTSGCFVGVFCRISQVVEEKELARLFAFCLLPMLRQQSQMNRTVLAQETR